ncbi:MULTISPECIES: paraquat-inducible protein A [Nitratireductor]|uniref:paraquat-inducible protein A n=1 Tax=Nitratireductor TaxID=245876 RepID=UPI000D0CD01B|nr:MULTISPECIES: paraquat-inducible protein A [Nitratireductor]PSM17316.1 paraquat-inducible protein A [Nitratireductor sp. StC3]
MRYLLPVLLFAATLCFALGIVLPLLRVDRLLVFTEEPSLVGLVFGLWTAGDWLLALLVGLFSIALPTLKLGLLHVAAYAGDGAHRSVPRWLAALSNWSMLDVVLVALVIFAAKTSGLAAAAAQPGLWFFAASVVLTATAAALVRHR